MSTALSRGMLSGSPNSAVSSASPGSAVSPQIWQAQSQVVEAQWQVNQWEAQLWNAASAEWWWKEVTDATVAATGGGSPQSNRAKQAESNAALMTESAKKNAREASQQLVDARANQANLLNQWSGAYQQSIAQSSYTFGQMNQTPWGQGMPVGGTPASTNMMGMPTPGQGGMAGAFSGIGGGGGLPPSRPNQMRASPQMGMVPNNNLMQPGNWYAFSGGQNAQDVSGTVHPARRLLQEAHSITRAQCLKQYGFLKLSNDSNENSRLCVFHEGLGPYDVAKAELINYQNPVPGGERGEKEYWAVTVNGDVNIEIMDWVLYGYHLNERKKDDYGTEFFYLGIPYSSVHVIHSIMSNWFEYLRRNIKHLQNAKLIHGKTIGAETDWDIWTFNDVEYHTCMIRVGSGDQGRKNKDARKLGGSAIANVKQSQRPLTEVSYFDKRTCQFINPHPMADMVQLGVCLTGCCAIKPRIVFTTRDDGQITYDFALYANYGDHVGFRANKAYVKGKKEGQCPMDKGSRSPYTLYDTNDMMAAIMG